MYDKPFWHTASGIVVLLGLFLAACEPRSAPETASPPQPTTVSEATEPIIPTPAEEEPITVRYGTIVEPDRIEHQFLCSTCWKLIDVIWPAWEDFGPDGEFVPRDAEVDISEDGKVFTFHLYPGMAWSDGTPFDASNLSEFWDWMANISIRDWMPLWKYSVSWKALDDLTFQVTTSVPIAAFRGNDNYLGNPLPPQVYGKMTEDEFWAYSTDTPLSNGPLKVVEWKRGQYMVYEAIPEYHLGAPPFDRAIVQFYANWDSVAQALLAGEIDAVPIMLPADYVDQLAADPDITVAEASPGPILRLFLNMSPEGNVHPALRDRRVREAIDYAIDKQKILDLALLGHGMLCPLRWHCGPYRSELLNPDIDLSPYEPETAKQILEQAGYVDTNGDGVREMEDGSDLTFRLQFDTLDAANQVAAEIVRDSLKAIGIKTDVEAVEQGALRELMLAAEDYDMVVMPHTADADPFTEWDWKASCWSAEEDTGMNYSNYCNEDFQALLDLVQTTYDPTQRKQYIFEMDQTIADDRPMIYLAAQNTLGAYRNDRVEMKTDLDYADYGYLFNWWSVMNMKVK